MDPQQRLLLELGYASLHGASHRRAMLTGGDGVMRRNDAAIVGRRLAQRRGLRVGDRLSAAGVTVSIAGILESEDPQHQNVAYVHLDFIQRAAGNKQGVVTQFNVEVTDPSRLDAVASTIDETFANSQAPTWTSSEKAFVARAVTDIVQLVEFAGWLGIGSLVAIFVDFCYE